MKNFKEFIKEHNENTLDEGFVDALKGLGKGLLHYSGAALGAVGGGIKSGFRAIAGGKDSDGHHHGHKYDTWKRDARADADRDMVKAEAKKKEKRQELTQTLKNHGTALGFDMTSDPGKIAHRGFMTRLHEPSHPDNGNMAIHSSGVAWDNNKNGGSGGSYKDAKRNRRGVRTLSAGEHLEAKKAFLELQKDREESGL